MNRITDPTLAAKVTTADRAGGAYPPRERTVGMSGFTGAGHPKAVPASARRTASTPRTRRERTSRINLLTGASTGEEVDGALAA